MDLPDAPSEAITDTESDPLVVSMRGDGALFMNTGAAATRKAGNEWHPGHDILFTRTGRENHTRAVEVPVYIKADQALNYGDVVRVMTVLQKAGAQSVGLITDPPQQIGS